jgi:hypothetical protein
MFQIKVVEKIETHMLLPENFSRKTCRSGENVGKCGGVRELADGNMAARCLLD